MAVIYILMAFVIITAMMLVIGTVIAFIVFGFMKVAYFVTKPIWEPMKKKRQLARLKQTHPALYNALNREEH